MVVRSASLARPSAGSPPPLRLAPGVADGAVDETNQGGDARLKSRTYYWCRSRHGDGIFPYFRQSAASWRDVYFETEIGNDRDVGDNFIIGPEIAGWDGNTTSQDEAAAWPGFAPAAVRR